MTFGLVRIDKSVSTGPRLEKLAMLSSTSEAPTVNDSSYTANGNAMVLHSDPSFPAETTWTMPAALVA